MKTRLYSVGINLVVLGLLAGLVPSTSFANGAWGGGDGYALDFVKTAREVLAQLSRVKPGNETEIDVVALKAAIDNTKVTSTKDPILVSDDPDQKDAKNNPELKEIVLSRGGWDALRDRAARLRLVLHEYCGIMRLNDKNYRISSVALSAPTLYNGGDHWELALDPVYDDAGEFSESLAAVRVGPKWGYIDSSGNFKIRPQYAGASKVSGGIAPVKSQDGLWGMIDIKTGQTVVDFKYDQLNSLSEGLALAIQVGVFIGYVDASGKQVISLPDDLKRAGDFRDGMALVTDQNGNSGYIDRTGRLAIPLRFEMATAFSHGVAAAIASNGADKSICLINKKGEQLHCKFQTKFAYLTDNFRSAAVLTCSGFSAGLLRCTKVAGLSISEVFYDKLGKKLDYNAKWATEFDPQTGLAAGCLGSYGLGGRYGTEFDSTDFCGFFDRDGNRVITLDNDPNVPLTEQIRSFGGFSEGMAVFSTKADASGSFGYIRYKD